MLSYLNQWRSYTNHPSKARKETNRGFQLAIEDAIDCIKAEPTIGKEKTGDLSGFLVYK